MPIVLLSLILPLTAFAGGPADSATVGLSLPLAQACLPPPDLDQIFEAATPFDDTGMIEPGAPSADDLSSAMDDFNRLLLRCVPDGQRVVADLDLDITVACTGRVSAATITNRQTLEPTLAACVQELLPFIAFAPHAIPDGYEFAYHMQIWFP
ncbi:MAG: hypothetical protein GXP62_17475 [Oligoflexia bacterium]|nr:hypothetical protein [Oligoflexia bacterium]